MVLIRHFDDDSVVQPHQLVVPDLGREVALPASSTESVGQVILRQLQYIAKVWHHGTAGPGVDGVEPAEDPKCLQLAEQDVLHLNIWCANWAFMTLWVIMPC